MRQRIDVNTLKVFKQATNTKVVTFDKTKWIVIIIKQDHNLKEITELTAALRVIEWLLTVPEPKTSDSVKERSSAEG